MNRIHRASSVFLRTLIASLLCYLFFGLFASAFAADNLRPQVGKPLQAAQALMKEQKYKDALDKIKEADVVPNKTPYEVSVLERMRGTASAGAGDLDAASKSFDAVFATKTLQPQDEQAIMRAMAGSYYRAKDYAKAQSWVQRYQKAGGTDPAMGMLSIQIDYVSGNYAAAAKGMQEQIAEQENAGKQPTEDQLQLLANCELKLNDNAGYQSALEKLVTWYPKKDYWTNLLSRVQRKPGFSDRLGLDVYRLMLLTGTLNSGGEYMEMAELALQAGYPKEAQKVLDLGYANKVVGTGSDADRQKRLKAMADKQNAEDEKTLGADVQSRGADAMVNTGYNLVIHGQTEKGLALMQKGTAGSDLKHPDDARLHLAEAYQLVGRKEDALKTLKMVQGKDGSQDLARLYALAIQAGKGGGA